MLQNRLAKNILIYVLLTAAILLPRIVELDRFVTVDEPVWISHSANFYYALGQRDPASTFQEYHPGVTTMWAGTTAILIYFPEYRALQQGYLHAINFSDYLVEQGKDPLTFLAISRTILVLGVTTILLIAFSLARRLLGLAPALFAILLIAFDPFFIGHSRLMNHEGLLSSFLILSILSFLVFLRDGRKYGFLVISALGAGLALLTKSPGIIIVPFITLLFIGDHLIRAPEKKHLLRPRMPTKQSLQTLLPFFIWAAVVAATYLALWPAMWSDPLGALKEVYGTALGYTTSGTRILAQDEFSGFSLSFNPSNFLTSLAWHTTPVQWAGAILAVPSLFTLYRKKEYQTLAALVIFGVFAILYVLMMSASRGRQSPHYIMSSYVSIDIVAGLSFVEIARAIKAYRPQVGTGIGFGVIILVILIQLFFSMSAFPYYYNFYNPLMGGNANASWQAVVGYGEGLDLAATYLSQKPDAQHLKAMSWYPIGCFSYFFEGETSPIFVADEWNQAKADTLKTMDYLVIYVGNERREETKDLALALGGVSPEHVIVFNGIEYAKIYKVSDMPEGIFQVE